MSAWPMHDELDKLGGAYTVPYGNTIRVTLGDFWAQYSIGQDEDFNITLGSFVDPRISLGALGLLRIKDLQKATFLLKFALDQLESSRTYLKMAVLSDDGIAHE